METKDYLKILKDEIHSVVIATVDDKGLPQTRVIDIIKKKTVSVTVFIKGVMGF